MPRLIKKEAEMARITVGLLIALTLLFPTLASSQSPTSSPSLEEALNVVELWLDAQRDFDRLPGISASIVHDQELIWSGAMGMADLNEERAATSETLYSICSISKLFTSVAIMQLRDQGKLRLSDRVSNHLPFFDLKQKYEDSTPITIEGLLTHSAGLPREAEYPYWSGPEYEFPTNEDVIERLLREIPTPEIPKFA